MMVFDPRTIARPVYEALAKLRSDFEPTSTDLKAVIETKRERIRAQKSQAVELYTYISTWGIMRLKAEEQALNQDDKEKKASSKEGKKDIIQKYFECLQKLSGIQNLSNNQGLKALKDMDTDEYLGITGLGLAIAQEFSFWATAVYHDIKGDN